MGGLVFNQSGRQGGSDTGRTIARCLFIFLWAGPEGSASWSGSPSPCPASLQQENSRGTRGQSPPTVSHLTKLGRECACSCLSPPPPPRPLFLLCPDVYLYHKVLLSSLSATVHEGILCVCGGELCKGEGKLILLSIKSRFEECVV